MTINLEKSNFIQKESAPSGVFRSHRKLNIYAHSLDFANFYRKFCARYSAATQDLNKLLQKGEKCRNEQHNFTKISADKAKCDICSVTLSIKGGSTTNLIRHTKTKHPTVNIDNLNKRVSLPEERKKLYKNNLFFLALTRFHGNQILRLLQKVMLMMLIVKLRSRQPLLQLLQVLVVLLYGRFLVLRPIILLESNPSIHKSAYIGD
jgi:ribosomal protein S27E